MASSLKKVLLSATLVPTVYSLALAPRQTTVEAPSITIVPALEDEVASGTEAAETEVPVPEPAQGPECTVWYSVKPGDTCTKISVNEHLSLDDIAEFNPDLVCHLLYPGDQMCIGIEGREPDPTRPQPILPGTTRDCNKYIQRQEGEGCFDIIGKYHIPEDVFHAWNTGLGGPFCGRLRDGFYMCVGVEGFEPDMSRPQPVMKGIVESCEEYYKVVRGDSCPGVSEEHGISLDEFYAWNPEINGACTNLQTDYYVCVRG